MRRIALPALVLVACTTPALEQPHVTVEIVDELGTRAPIADCNDAARCRLRAGRDRVVVQASFEGVNVEEQTALSSPTVTVLVDGAADLHPPALSQIMGRPRTFVSGSWLAPTSGAATVSFTVKGSPGYETTLAGFSVVSSAPNIALVGCTTVPCNATNDVGTASFKVSAWVPVGTVVQVRSIVDNVVTEIAPNPAFHAAGIGPATADVPALAVPPSGTKWFITAAVDGLPLGDAFAVNLTPPAVTLAVQQCTSLPCTLSAGANASLALKVPRDLNTKTATLRFLVNGATDATLPDLTLALDPLDRTATAKVKLPLALAAVVLISALVGATGRADASVTTGP